MVNKIIVEGPNNVGKTAFINALLQEPKFCDWSVEHITGAAPNDFEFYDKTLELSKNVIFDRHCIGELVYPMLYNREPKMTLTDVIELLKKYETNTMVFLIDADFTFIYNACKNKNENFDINFVANERANFNRAFKELKSYTNIFKLTNHLDAVYIKELTIDGAILLARQKCAEGE